MNLEETQLTYGLSEGQNVLIVLNTEVVCYYSEVKLFCGNRTFLNGPQIRLWKCIPDYLLTKLNYFEIVVKQWLLV